MDDDAFRQVMGSCRGVSSSTRAVRRGERCPRWYLDSLDPGIKYLFGDATDEEIIKFLFEQGIQPE